jgi:Zn-dependent protease with chaperone function
VTAAPAVNLVGLYPQAYEHPDDAAALDALQHTAGLDNLIRAINSWGFERLLRIQLTGSYLRVTPDNFPELWRLLTTARERLSLPLVPELYLKNDEEINAFTAGVEQPVIVVNSGTIDHLDEDELLFVIAHEVGHIKSGHVLYYQIASYLPVIGSIIGDLTFNIGNLMGMGLQIALLHWKRTSELTADRAGLLACQDMETATRAMMKLAGLPRKYADKANPEDFIRQAKDFEAFDLSRLNKIAKYLSIYGSDHPWTVIRAKELLTWVDSGGYEQIVNRARSANSSVAPAPSRFCDQCRAEVQAGDTFCPKCGHQLPRDAPVH